MGNNEKTIWQRVLAAWPVIAFSTALAITIGSGYVDVKTAAAQNTTATITNTKDIRLLAEEMKEEFAKRAMKFLTQTEFNRLWDNLKAQEATAEDFEDILQQLLLSDERVNAKIELEVTKLRNEIGSAAARQQRALDTQTDTLQQILREVQGRGN